MSDLRRGKERGEDWRKKARGFGGGRATRRRDGGGRRGEVWKG